jgi:hypothetical protein
MPIIRAFFFYTLYCEYFNTYRIKFQIILSLDFYKKKLYY